MILYLQIPIFDIRPFLAETGRISVIRWPAPISQSKGKGGWFIRNFGQIRPRDEMAISSWALENELCEAKKALKIKELPAWNGIQIKGRTRHFFSGELAVGKFESVFTATNHKWDAETGEFLDSFIMHFLTLPVSTNTDKAVSNNLFQIGEELSQKYLTATTQKRWAKAENKEPDRLWTTAGNPLLFIECSEDELRNLKKTGKKYQLIEVPLPIEFKSKLYHFLFQANNYYIRTWLLIRGTSDGLVNRKLASIRILIMRLNAEYLCLNYVLTQIKNHVILPTRGTIESENLQRYLCETEKHIRQYKSSAKKLSQSEEIERISKTAFDMTFPVDSILDDLKGIRKQVLKNLGELLRETKTPNTTIKNYGTLNMNTNNFDRNTFSNSNVNIGFSFKDVENSLENTENLSGYQKEQLQLLLNQLNELLRKLPDNSSEVKELSKQTKDFVEEVSKPKIDSKKTYLSIEKLQKAAENVAKLSPPIVLVVKQIISLFQ